MEEHYLTIATRMIAALLAGGIIGFERTYHGRPAGFRTHMLVCTASTLLILVSVYQWELLPNAPRETLRIDPTRMAQGIMTGIGFLGAGVIVKERLAVRGLTTAASIWVTSALGIVIGMGFYSAAILGTVLVLGTLSVFRWIESIMPAVHYARLTVRFSRHDRLSRDELNQLVTDHGISSTSPSYHLEDEGRTFEYKLSIRSKDARNFQRLADSLSKMERVHEFNISPTGE